MIEGRGAGSVQEKDEDGDGASDDYHEDRITPFKSLVKTSLQHLPCDLLDEAVAACCKGGPEQSR